MDPGNSKRNISKAKRPRVYLNSWAIIYEEAKVNTTSRHYQVFEFVNIKLLKRTKIFGR